MVSRSALDQYLTRNGFGLADIAQNLDLVEGDVPFVTGSILDGVGDSSSDLDVHVLTTEEGLRRRARRFSSERKHQQARQRFGILYIQIGSHEIDAEFHERAKMEELLAALRSMNPRNFEEIFASADSLGRFERAEALDLLHRFLIGMPIANEEAFRELRSRFDEEKYFLWNTHYHLMRAREFQKGTRRSLGENDPENAYLKLMRLYDSLADAYLFARGQSLDRWKWRLPKLRMYAEQEFLELYLDVQLLRAGESDLDAFVNKSLGRSGEIADRIFEDSRL